MSREELRKQEEARNEELRRAELREAFNEFDKVRGQYKIGRERRSGSSWFHCDGDGVRSTKFSRRIEVA